MALPSSVQHMQELEDSKRMCELPSQTTTADTLPSPRDTESTCSNSPSQSPKAPTKWADMVDDDDFEDDFDRRSVQTRDSDKSVPSCVQEKPEKLPTKQPSAKVSKQFTSSASSQSSTCWQPDAYGMNNDAMNQQWAYQGAAWGTPDACGYAFMPMPMQMPMVAMPYCWAAGGVVAAGKEEGFTVVVRNIPNKYTRDMFVKELTRSGFQEAFDFVYVPIDPETEANKGYAFVNFVNAVWSDKFTGEWQNRQMEQHSSDKRITVAPAIVQGFNANYQQFCDSHVYRLKPSMRPLFIWEKDFSGITAKPSGRKSKLGSRRGDRQTADSAATASDRRCGGAAAASKDASAGEQTKDARCCGVQMRAAFKFCPMCGKTV